MAKRRKRSGGRKTRTRTITKYKYRSRAKRGGGRRRRRSGGGGGGIVPSRDELYDMAAAGVYGLVERKAKADQSFFLNTLVAKTPIPQLGFAGNIAVAARLANKFAFHHPMLKRFASVTAQIAIYQMARQGAVFTSVAPFTVSGELDDDGIAGELDDETMGALAADADAMDLEGDDEVGDEMADDAMMGDY